MSRRKGFTARRAGTFAGARSPQVAREEMVCAVPACPRSTPNYPICGVCRRFLSETQNETLYATFRGLRYRETVDDDGESARRQRAYNNALAVAVKAVVDGKMRQDEERAA